MSLEVPCRREPLLGSPTPPDAVVWQSLGPYVRSECTLRGLAQSVCTHVHAHTRALCHPRTLAVFTSAHPHAQLALHHQQMRVLFSSCHGFLQVF